VRFLRLFVVVAAALSCSCSALTPYPTFSAPVAGDPRQRVAVCFNKFKNSDEQVQQVAQGECLGNTVAERTGTDYILDYCPFAVPGRALFVCVPRK